MKKLLGNENNYCWITLRVYGWGKISGVFGIKEITRKGWRQ